MLEIRAESAFDFLSEEYKALFNASAATAFQHPIWLDCFYRDLVAQIGAVPAIITARSGPDRELVMVLPLVRRRHGGVRVIEFADLQVSDYIAPVCSPETFAHALDAGFARSLRKVLGSHDVVWLRKLCDGGLPVERLFGVTSRFSMGMSAYSVPLYPPYSQWRIDQLDPSYRKELDKKRRKMLRRGELRLEWVRSADAIKGVFDRLREYRWRRFQDSDLLQNPTYFDFYRNVAVQGAATDYSRTFAILMDGEPLAVVWGIRDRGRFLVLLSGFDRQGHKNRSVGSLIFDQVAATCIDEGDSLLDFTIGDEPYKTLFGGRPSKMWMASGAGNPFGLVVNMVARQMPWIARLANDVIRAKSKRTNGATNDAAPAGPPVAELPNAEILPEVSSEGRAAADRGDVPPGSRPL